MRGRRPPQIPPAKVISACRTDAENFIHAQRLQGPSRQSGNFERVTQSIQHFHGISGRAIGSLAFIHQLYDIATPQALFRQIAA
jgi:hypothetical protein